MAEPTRAEPSRAEKLRAVSAADIEDTYRRGYITAGDRNRVMREKAHATIEEALGEQGYLKAIFTQTLVHAQEGWDLFKAQATRERTDKGTPEAARQDIEAVAKAVWAQIQMLTAPFMAIGEVTGQQAENWALGAGASPGLARVINIVADVGSGIIPVGGAARSGVKGTQAIMQKVSGTPMTSAAKAGAKAAESVAKMARALGEGLKVEGVKNAEQIVAKGIGAETVGLAQKAPAAEGLLPQTVEAITQAAPGSVREQFLADMTTFRNRLRGITERQAHAETARLADRLGLSLDDLKNVVPGQALDEKQMLAYLKALEPQVTTAIDLAKQAVRGGEIEANAFAQHMSEFLTVAPIFRGAEVTAGRSVEILKETPPMKRITDMLMGWDPESVAKGDFQGAIKSLAEDVVALGEEPDKVAALGVLSQTGWQRFKDSAWPMAREAYINLLLARPITQVRNFLGNGIAGAQAILERTAGGALSIDKEKGLVGQEGWYLLKGMTAALGDGLKAFGQAYTHLDPTDVSKLDYVPHQIPGPLGRLINLPGDTLRGMDNFYKTIFRRGSYYADALRDGIHQGKRGADLQDFIARRVNAPNQAMRTSAEEFAVHNTFQDDLGRLGQKIASTAQTGPLALWFPFMKTPINLAKYAWNRTPGLQLASKSLYDDIAAGGVRADMAIGRLTISNLMGMFIFNLAQEGLITGSGPVDPALRRAWLATHQPYSVKTPAGWIPISNTEPGSTSIGIIADYAQIMNQLDAPSAEQGAMAIAFTLMKDLADKTYFKTVGDLVDVASGLALGHEPGTKFRQVLLGPVTTVVTGGPLGAAVTRAIDPIRRESRSFMDGLIARVPGYSKTLPPVRDGYGDPILPPQAVGGPWVGIVSPLTIKPFTDDPVKVEGDRLQVKIPAVPGSVGGTTRDDFDIRAPLPEDKVGVELSSTQRDRWQQIYRNLLRHPEHGIQAQLLANPEYQTQPRAAQREMFMDFLASSRTTAREAMVLEDPKLGEQILRSNAAAIAPLLQRQDQDALPGQTQEAVDLFSTMSQEMRENLLRWGIYGDDEGSADQAPPSPSPPETAPTGSIPAKPPIPATAPHSVKTPAPLSESLRR